EGFTLWQKVSAGSAHGFLQNRFLLQQARIWVARRQPEIAIARLDQVKDAMVRLPLRADETQAKISLAEIYLRQNRIEDSVRAARDALDHIESSPVRTYYQTLEAEAALRLGESRRRAGDPMAARPHLERAMQLRAATDDATSPWLAEAQIAL